MRLNLTNHFLIAMPALDDPNFARTVTYVCAHNEDGAMGIVINRPLEMDLGEVLQQLDLETADPQINAQPVYAGGPVHRDRGFIIHRPSQDFGSTLRVTEDIAVSTSRDILAAIARGEGPHDTLIALGYAGWGAGQLEMELAENVWLVGEPDVALVYDPSLDTKWSRALARIGISPDRLQISGGRA